MTLEAFLKHFGFGLTLFAISVALTWAASRMAWVMDVPNERSSHARPVPRAGGVAIVGTFIAGLVTIYFMADIARIEDRYFWGFLACIALLANLLLTIAFMVAVDATFTLPGLAGLVLMLGMAVDANILIYERLREEEIRGLSLRMALRNSPTASAAFDGIATCHP